ncbi:HD domain-containing phosphohydrolase [Nitratidesulfovibrio liaohensis]|uniref:Response regulator n=1 Tax=Nitratidesulfovibrio liaohensis TaxID=2604158 RepID=A0ABY9QYW3_9BACT|nr:HD domain-containing phosphohydrolase [Nitratidesulfovibrio liaohensis]WMW64689.1 response regulator [Nitratidesulfovibrio liaohensis]
MAKVLCIDDEPLMRLVTCDYLKDMGHEVLEAASSAEGIALFQKHHPDIVLSDLRMPGGDGFLVVEHMAEEAPDTPVVIISGTGTVAEAVKILRLGAWDYLTKPLTSMPLFAQTLERMLDKARALKATTQHLRGLELRNQELERKLLGCACNHRGMKSRLAAAIKAGINSLHIALHEQDPSTAGHNEGVARLSVDIGSSMGLGEQRLEALKLAGLLHDIGKIAVPKDILNKRGPLSAKELKIVRSHVACGYRILRNIPFEGPVAEAVLQHHERFDGSGYPNGLASGGILLEARILAVADVYDALCSDRPYRPGLCPSDATGYILGRAGTHFCPLCVTAFEQVISKRHMEGETQ